MIYYLYEDITPAVMPTIAESNKYAKNNSIMVKSILNKISIAQALRSLFCHVL